MYLARIRICEVIFFEQLLGVHTKLKLSENLSARIIKDILLRKFMHTHAQKGNLIKKVHQEVVETKSHFLLNNNSA